ncbi:MAG TPA: glutathione transferase GstA [Polyangiaceae bacterium]|jgi:glutathione S-transferase|nr:glutathione transferase GstA [Polyangiaceae bacterium]
MKLYFSPGACSLHPHITLRETGLPFDLVRVDLRAHKLHDGTDYYGINAKGYVPALELDDGAILTEGAVIDQYVADRKPESKLLPAAGTMERYRALEWLNFIATEIHKTFGPLFGSDEAAKEAPRARLARRFEFTAKALDGRPYLLGDTFGVADAYLYNMLRWTHTTGVALDPWPALKAFYERVDARPAVQAALAAEKAR